MCKLLTICFFFPWLLEILSCFNRYLSYVEMPCFASLFILMGGKWTDLIKSIPLDSYRKSGLPSLWSNINSQRRLHCHGKVQRYHSTWCPHTSFLQRHSYHKEVVPSLFIVISFFFSFKVLVSTFIHKVCSSLSFDLSQEQ